MLMPVFAVKSLDSSTSALAGSHAAQHSVRSFALALPPIATPALSTVPKRNRFSLLMNASVRATYVALDGLRSRRPAPRRAELASSPDRGQGTRRQHERPRSLDWKRNSRTRCMSDNESAREWCRAIDSSLVAGLLASWLLFASARPVDGANTKLN